MINMKQYCYMLLEKFSRCDRKALYFLFLEFSCHAMVVALCNRLPHNTLYYIVYRNELRFSIFYTSVIIAWKIRAHRMCGWDIIINMILITGVVEILYDMWLPNNNRFYHILIINERDVVMLSNLYITIYIINEFSFIN